MKYIPNNIWKYRELIWILAINDIKIRYKSSILGIFWSFLEPLLMLLVLYIVFSNLMKSDVQYYALFLLMGIISWNFLCRGTSSSLNCIWGNPSLVGRIYIPREVLVIGSCVAAFLTFLIELSVFAVIMVFFGVIPTFTILYLPFILVIEFLLVIGISFALSSLNVFYRDVQYIWGVIIQAGFFATPIFYPLSILPSRFAEIIRLNPMTGIIDALRDSVIYHTTPITVDLIYSITAAFVLLIIGYSIFIKIEPGFAEEVG